MGMSIGFSSSSLDESVALCNPDPSEFTILSKTLIEGNLVIKVHYKGCTNYEGNKILLFCGVSVKQVLKINDGKIDPHFSENPRTVHPFARFEPTQKGWEMAVRLASLIGSDNKHG